MKTSIGRWIYPVLFTIIPCLIALMITGGNHTSNIFVLVLTAVVCTYFYCKYQIQKHAADAGSVKSAALVLVLVSCSLALYINDIVFSFVFLLLSGIINACSLYGNMPRLIRNRKFENCDSKESARRVLYLCKIINKGFQLMASLALFFVIPFFVSSLIENNQYMVLLLLVMETASLVFLCRKQTKQIRFENSIPDGLSRKIIRFFPLRSRKTHQAL